jgi:hypothetical protein
MRSHTCNCHGIIFRSLSELTAHLATHDAVEHATRALRETVRVYEAVANKWQSDYETVAGRICDPHASPSALIAELDRRDRVIVSTKQRIDYLITQLESMSTDRLDRSKEIAKLRDTIDRIQGVGLKS